MEIKNKNCRCPICRFCRGEISSNECAWYLKGKIEAYNRVISIHNRPPEMKSPFKTLECEVKANMEDDECALSELLNSNKKPKKIDEAWIYPKVFNLGRL